MVTHEFSFENQVGISQEEALQVRRWGEVGLSTRITASVIIYLKV